MDSDSIDALVARFEDATLPPSALDHRAHLVIALVYARRHGAAAVHPFGLALERYLWEHAGDLRGYHETMTVAWLRLVVAFSEETAALALPEAAARLCERYPSKHALDVHYSPARLMSDAARAGFVEPDRAPLPSALPAADDLAQG